MDWSTPRKLTGSHCSGRRCALVVDAPRRMAQRLDAAAPVGSCDSEKCEAVGLLALAHELRLAGLHRRQKLIEKNK